MKRKARIKNKKTYCFLCGCEFQNQQDKHIHRINTKKGVCERNVVILCQNCKKLFQKDENLTIYTIKLNKVVKNRYFYSETHEIKQAILGKIRYFRSMNNGNEDY